MNRTRTILATAITTAVVVALAPVAARTVADYARRAGNAKTADDADRLGGKAASRYVRHCDQDALGAWAFVPSNTPVQWTEVQGFSTEARDRCVLGPAYAKHVSTGVYDVELIGASDNVDCFELDIEFPMVITVAREEVLPPTYRTGCDVERGLTTRVFVEDRNGLPVDATFTIVQISRYVPQ